MYFDTLRLAQKNTTEENPWCFIVMVAYFSITHYKILDSCQDLAHVAVKLTCVSSHVRACTRYIHTDLFGGVYRAVEVVFLRNEDAFLHAEDVFCASYGFYRGKSLSVKEDILFCNAVFNGVFFHIFDLAPLSASVARKEKYFNTSVFVKRDGGVHPILKHMGKRAALVNLSAENDGGIISVIRRNFPYIVLGRSDNYGVYHACSGKNEKAKRKKRGKKNDEKLFVLRHLHFLYAHINIVAEIDEHTGIFRIHIGACDYEIRG